MTDRIPLEEPVKESQIQTIPGIKFIPSGSTMLDLALNGGWALGRVFNIVGDKSTGKCVRNAYIINQQGLERIDDIGKNFDYDISQWKQNLGLTSEKSITCSHFYKEKVQKTITITTRHGYSLEGTLLHPILCWTKDCDFEFKKLSELQIDDIVVIVKNADSITRSEIELPLLPKREKHDTSIKHCITPSIVTPALARILGLFVADGNFQGYAFNWSNKASWFRSVLIDSSLECFGVEPIETPGDAGESNSYTLSRIQISKWLDILLEGKSDNFTARFKFIPKVILQSSKHIQIEFLKCLIDCDSWFDIEGSSIQYSTASEVLAQQVQLLLLNLGVVSTKTFDDNVKGYEGHKYWNVCIHGKQLCKYLNTVGSYRDNIPNPKNLDKSDYDVIPFLKTRIEKDIENAKLRTNWGRNGKTSRGRFPEFQINADNITFPFLRYFIQKFFSSKFSDLFDWEFYNKILNSEFHFDTIKEIKEVENEVDVFDVHVPDTHSFWSNGFISHNTLHAIEAFANFKRVYPKGLMRYAEAEAAFDDAFAEQLGFPEQVARNEELIQTVEDFKLDFAKFVKRVEEDKAEGGLYILDSLDALSDSAEVEAFETELAGKEQKGTFGVGKAKEMSKFFRQITQMAFAANVSLGVISQIRDNIGVMFGETKTRSGGRALDFYASQVIWLAETKKLEREIKAQKRVYGIQVIANVKKNKVGKPFRKVKHEIIFGYGVDNENAMIDWLKEVGAFNKDTAKNLSDQVETARKKQDFASLIQIEANLKKDATLIWNEIEDRIEPPIRKYRDA